MFSKYNSNDLYHLMNDYNSERMCEGKNDSPARSTHTQQRSKLFIRVINTLLSRPHKACHNNKDLINPIS